MREVRKTIVPSEHPTIVKRVEVNPNSAQTFIRDTQNHNSALSKYVKVPRLVGINVSNSRFVEIEQEDILGHTLEDAIKKSGRAVAVESFEQMLDFFLPVIKSRHEANGEITAVPVDAHADNVVRDSAGTLYYVDVIPPLTISKGGKLEFWEHRRRTLEGYAFRRTRPEGILQNMLFMTIRTRPELRQEFESAIKAFLEKNGLHDELKHVNNYIQTGGFEKDFGLFNLKRHLDAGGIFDKRSP